MFLVGCLFNIEVILKFQLKCLILGVNTCFYQVVNWHKEAFQEFEEEEVMTVLYSPAYLLRSKGSLGLLQYLVVSFYVSNLLYVLLF